MKRGSPASFRKLCGYIYIYIYAYIYIYVDLTMPYKGFILYTQAVSCG